MKLILTKVVEAPNYMLFKNKIHNLIYIGIPLFLLVGSVFYYLNCITSSSIYGKKIHQTEELIDLYSKKNADLVVEKSKYETVTYVQEKATALNMTNISVTFAKGLENEHALSQNR